MSLKLVMFAPTLVSTANAPLPIARSMRKPVSLLELSFQIKSIRVCEMAEATRLLGSAGATGVAVNVSLKERNCAVARFVEFREQTAIPRYTLAGNTTLADVTTVQLVPSVLKYPVN